MLAEGQRFLTDTGFRRAALERSLVNHENMYSRLRIASYGLGERGWDRLPEWNPRSMLVTSQHATALARGEMPVIPADRNPLWDGVEPVTMEGWVALGKRVFTEYPMRAEVFMEWGLGQRGIADAVGVERTKNGDVPGLVVFANVDGETRVGITCAICHATVRDGELVIGSARRSFDYGRLRLEYFAATGDDVEPSLAERMAGWGPGRADVTEDDDEDPVSIPDLWGLRSQAWLTQAGTIRHESPVALAIRQETQLTDSNHLLVRPPRALAWALAMYVYSLTPPPDTATHDESRVAKGKKLFERHCRSCHANAAYGGDAVSAESIGTAPALANGRGRGTGRYRVPPLVRVREGAPYLHDGSVSSLEELISAERLDAGYSKGRLGSGPIEGHVAGTALSPEERDSLIAFLGTL